MPVNIVNSHRVVIYTNVSVVHNRVQVHLHDPLVSQEFESIMRATWGQLVSLLFEPGGNDYQRAIP